VPGILDPYYKFSNARRVALQAHVKNTDLFFTSSNLIIQGHYGAARVILRQVFEFLFIGKYASLTHKDGFINRWLEGKQVNIYDETIKRLVSPDKEEFHNLWVFICDATHATVFSNQISFDFETNKKEITNTYAILLMLYCCNYHLLSTWILNKSLIYRSEYYGNHKAENTALKKEARLLIKAVRQNLSDRGAKFLNNYTKQWNYI